MEEEQQDGAVPPTSIMTELIAGIAALTYTGPFVNARRAGVEFGRNRALMSRLKLCVVTVDIMFMGLRVEATAYQHMPAWLSAIISLEPEWRTMKACVEEYLFYYDGIFDE